MTKVFIAPGDSYHAAISMFERAGFEPVKHYDGVDLVVFLGGTDVDPTVYGEEAGPYTQQPDKQRDKTEIALFEKFKSIPKVGICRGGQLLNVLNGGKMIQHLGKCISGDVDTYDVDNRVIRELRVDHHQGIVGKSMGLADTILLDGAGEWRCDYVVPYEDTKSLCFQPHPEWQHEPTENYFFELIERYFGFVRKAGVPFAA